MATRRGLALWNPSSERFTVYVPDPDQPDGLPYIRRDGETNPDSQGAGAGGGA